MENSINKREYQFDSSGNQIKQKPTCDKENKTYFFDRQGNQIKQQNLITLPENNHRHNAEDDAA